MYENHSKMPIDKHENHFEVWHRECRKKEKIVSGHETSEKRKS
jgi:hypothetical protein